MRLLKFLRPVVCRQFSSQHRRIDLRSDTVNVFSKEMREAMASYPVGDDVYAEDASVNYLQDRCAKLLNKEASLFVASGTMANLVSIMAHCQRGDEIIVGLKSHIKQCANYTKLASVSATTIDENENGEMNLSEIEENIRIDDCHMPYSRVICLENTHTFLGGIPLKQEYLRSIQHLAKQHNLFVHIDGARLFNAAVAQNVEVSELSQYGDSVTMCFSKGLGAPVGSIVAGTADFINRAHRARKALGGGWRQAGILAAAAHVALDKAMETVAEDHRKAAFLAQGLSDSIPKDLKHVASVTAHTNMVVLNHMTKELADDIYEDCLHDHILPLRLDETRLRFVPNSSVSHADLCRIIESF